MVSLRVEAGDFSISLEKDEEKQKLALTVITPRTKVIRGSSLARFPSDFSPTVPFVSLQLAGLLESNNALSSEEEKALQNMLQRAELGEMRRPLASAPIRSKPERSYDPTQDTPKPEGGHVPMVLADIFSGQTGEWEGLAQALKRFGSACGLFDAIQIRRPGSRPADPFQIRVKLSGLDANLIDVGYGVSQILPILVDAIRSHRHQMFLMQQPEVHLHPRAQAELGTLLGHLSRKDHKRFVVETHSDYLIDRVCLDIRDKNNGLTPDDVVILYFEKKKRWVKIHPIRIDEAGNIQDVPKGYRDFFLREQARLFGVE